MSYETKDFDSPGFGFLKPQAGPKPSTRAWAWLWLGLTRPQLLCGDHDKPLLEHGTNVNV